MTTRLLIAGACAAAILTAATGAAAATASGSSGGLSWQAANTIVGFDSTATIATGGNPAYVAPMPKFSGVVSLIMDEGAAGLFICSGSLLPNRTSVLTAGHCVSHGAGTAAPISTTAYFYGGSDPDTVVPLNAVSTAITARSVVVDPLYTGQVIDQNDLAIVQLSAPAPAFAQSYSLYDGGPLTGQDFNVAGYGARSDGGGNVGDDLGTGRLRQGDNRYDFALGDSDFGGFFDGFFGTAASDDVLLSDFDNGLAANDASCQLAAALGLSATPKFCNLGLGLNEVSVAGGDSGGPQFVNGQIASVTSFGLSFGKDVGDIDDDLNSTFGEFNGFVPTNTAANRAFILSVTPEPSAWALMLVGFGGLGAALRRRRATALA